MRICEICGARVTNLNHRVTTCGTICTEAKRTGRTLKHQMKREAEHASDYRATAEEIARQDGLATKPLPPSSPIYPYEP